MAIIVAEKWESRETTEGDNPSIELVFTIHGTDDDIAAKTALASAAPAIYDGLVRQSLHIERIAEQAWEGTVRYGRIQPPQTGDSSYQFETGGGTQHITQSIQTVQIKSPPGEVAPDFQGAINVSGDNIEGVDINVPIYHFSETHYIAAELVTPAYKAALFWLTGKVNDAPFRGFARGEVLFLGASGSKRGQEDWEISFRFAASPNAVNLTVGPITGINKEGWHYLWVRYENAKDENSNRLVMRPIAAYVEQVYQYADFGGLGIGS